MSKYLISLTMLVFLAAATWSQEENSGNEPAMSSAPEEVVDDVVTETQSEDVNYDVGDDELDDQTYEEDEDDFVPSEEIPADEPIPFPSNI